MSKQWRHNALTAAALLGIVAASAGVAMPANVPVTPFGFARRKGGRGGSPRHYLRRVTNEMLARGWRPKPVWRGDR